MHCGADVVQEPRQRECLGSQAAANDRFGFEYDDRSTGARERDGGGETVRPRPDDDGVEAHPSIARFLRACRVEFSGGRSE